MGGRRRAMATLGSEGLSGELVTQKDCYSCDRQGRAGVKRGCRSTRNDVGGWLKGSDSSWLARFTTERMVGADDLR